MDDDKLLRKMSVGDVLDYSIEVFRKNFKQIIILALIFYVPFMVLYAVAASYLSGELLDFVKVNDYTGSNEVWTQLSRIMAYYLAIGVLSLLYFIYSITLKPVMDAAIIRITHSYIMTGTVPATKQAIRESFGKFGSLFVYRLLFSLLIAGITTAALVLFYILLFIFAFGVLFSYSAAGGNAASTPAIVAITAFVIAVIAGAALGVAYIVIKFLFGEQAVILEARSGVSAFGRSGELTKKSFWHILVCYLLGWLLFFTIPQMLASAAFLLIYVNKDLYLIAVPLMQVVNSILYPFIPILMTVLYINLKIRREGYDLEQRVDILLMEQRNTTKDIELGEQL